MAYKEPHAVIVSLDDPNNHKIGQQFCYHFTLTYSQVKSKLQELNAEVEKWKKYTGNFGRDATITLLSYYVPLVNTVTIPKLLFDCYANHSLKDALELQDTYKKIYIHMGQNNYKRVTISQAYIIERIDRELLHTNLWKTTGPLRVPIEGYYYKN